MQSLLALLATVVAMLPWLTSPSGTYGIQEGVHYAEVNQNVPSTQAMDIIDLDQPERDAKAQVNVSARQKAVAENELSTLFHDTDIQEEVQQVHASPSVSSRQSSTPVINLDEADAYVTQDVDAYSKTLSYEQKKVAEDSLTQLFADMGLTQ